MPVDKGRAWLVVTMLFFFMFVNFADKVVLGVTAPALMRDLGISASQYGYLASAFFIFFVASTVPVGLISDRISNKALLLIMAAIWSATQVPMTFTTTFGVLFASRMVLGAAEGPTTMSAQAAVYKWFPNERRTLPASIMNQLGSSAGIFFGVPVLSWITQAYSWHAAFGSLGLLGGLWCLVWLAIGQDGPIDASGPRPAQLGHRREVLSYLLITRKRTFVGVLCCGFASYWGITLLTTWSVTFFVKSLNFSPAAAAWYVSLVAVASAAVGLASGWFSQILSTRGLPSRTARGLIVGIVTLISGLCLIAMTQIDLRLLQIVLFVVAFSVTSAVYTPSFAMIAEISPLEQRGGAFGMFTALMCSAGIVAPSVMGLTVEYGGGFDAGFLLTGLLTIVAALVGLVTINPERDRALASADVLIEGDGHASLFVR